MSTLPTGNSLSLLTCLVEADWPCAKELAASSGVELKQIYPHLESHIKAGRVQQKKGISPGSQRPRLRFQITASGLDWLQARGFLQNEVRLDENPYLIHVLGTAHFAGGYDK